MPFGLKGEFGELGGFLQYRKKFFENFLKKYSFENLNEEVINPLNPPNSLNHIIPLSIPF